ncbi:MAG: hypothetical protein HYV03_07955 [Deltaproteobacteria bacterium]|nr:hypothetical protein [Deltaproteobacteria bacterium]
MSMGQKYTWADFLKDHPELKTKGVKRTSKEGKKAFEEAYKTALKSHLKGLSAKLEREGKKATARRTALTTMLKADKGTVVAKVLQQRVGQKDHAIAFLARQIERAKAAQKTL